LVDYGVTHQYWLYNVYEKEEWRLTYSKTTRSPAPREPLPARETIFPDSVKDFYRPEVEIRPLDSVKTILGYLCRQAQVRLTIARPDTAKPFRRTITVFYTDQLPNVQPIFRGLGGLPLEYWEVTLDPAWPAGFWERHVATAVGRGPVPAAYFNPRGLYPGVPVITRVPDGKPLPSRRLNRPRPVTPSYLRKNQKKPKYSWSNKG
jgi:hypothetical protein